MKQLKKSSQVAGIFQMWLGALTANISVSVAQTVTARFTSIIKTTIPLFYSRCVTRIANSWQSARGTFARVGDAGIFQKPHLGEYIRNNLFDLPGPKQLPNSNIIAPYVFLRRATASSALSF